MKVALIVQRYGQEVIGGSETLARQYAELLQQTVSVDVLTTCALDHVTWRNRFAPGITREHGVTVHRFPVDFERGPHWWRLHGMLTGAVTLRQFAESPSRKQLLARRLATWKSTVQEETIRLQGPYSTGLLNYLARHRLDYDVFLFCTYLFPPTFYGIRRVPAERAVLCPTLHDEPMAYLPLYQQVFRRACFTLFLSDAERRLAGKLFGGTGPSDVVGLPIGPAPEEAALPDTVPPEYLLYAGRIESGKGTDDLCRHFLAFKKRYPSELKLVLIGRKVFPLPRHPDIVYRGFVDESEKHALMKGARAFVQPSAFESFSIVLMESFRAGTPALVNRHCAVLDEHCRQSGAGLSYGTADEFAQGLLRLLANPELRAQMGARGQRYVQVRYASERVEHKLLRALQAVAARSSVPEERSCKQVSFSISNTPGCSKLRTAASGS